MALVFEIQDPLYMIMSVFHALRINYYLINNNKKPVILKLV